MTPKIINKYLRVRFEYDGRSTWREIDIAWTKDTKDYLKVDANREMLTLASRHVCKSIEKFFPSVIEELLGEDDA